jgi:hypothetical protein
MSMRKIVVSAFLSLDGVAESPDTFLTDWDDDVMDAHMSAAIDTQDAVILGRRSYDEWARFWPESTIEPYATFINSVAKFVVTSRPLDTEWAHSDVVEGGLVGETTAEHGQGLCAHDNQVKEMPGWSVRVEPGGRHRTVITTPTGHSYESSAPPALGHGSAQPRRFLRYGRHLRVGGPGRRSRLSCRGRCRRSVEVDAQSSGLTRGRK